MLSAVVAAWSPVYPAWNDTQINFLFVAWVSKSARIVNETPPASNVVSLSEPRRRRAQESAAVAMRPHRQRRVPDLGLGARGLGGGKEDERRKEDERGKEDERRARGRHRAPEGRRDGRGRSGPVTVRRSPLEAGHRERVGQSRREAGHRERAGHGPGSRRRCLPERVALPGPETNGRGA